MYAERVTAKLVVAGVGLLASFGAPACQAGIDEVDGAYYGGGPRRVHCSIDIDSVTRNDDASIDAGLDRARDRGEVLELFAHDPGVTVSWDSVEHVFAGAVARGLPFVAYGDLARGDVTGPGLAFSFDDTSVGAWTDGRALFAKYGARLTFFVTRYDRLDPEQHAQLQQLAADGHDIEAHSVQHLRGPVVVEAEGLAGYLADEVQPSIDRLRADGYTITTYAYPFGARTDETDRAILERVPILRSVAMTWGGVIEDPCPAD